MKSGQGTVAGSWQRDLTDRWGQASLSSLRSVGASLASGLKAGYESLTHDSTDKEMVTMVKFAQLEYGAGSHHHATRRALLLGYQNGFQVWDLEDARLVRELASRRDGAVRFANPITCMNVHNQCSTHCVGRLRQGCKLHFNTQDYQTRKYGADPR